MSTGKDVIKLDNPQDALAFISDPLRVAEALTGILVSDKKEWILSASKLVQASLKFKLLTQLGRELNGYREKGKIKEDYFATNSNQSSFNELLRFIDEEVPDEERMRAMKSIFLASISPKATEEDERLAYELMQLCRKLSSGDLLVLKATYEISKGKARGGIEVDTQKNIGAAGWLQVVAHQIGHNLPSLVEAHEQRLMELRLISQRMFSDLSGFAATQHFRLTSSGYKLCEFISQYP
jgi:hypothetical protein